MKRNFYKKGCETAGRVGERWAEITRKRFENPGLHLNININQLHTDGSLMMMTQLSCMKISGVGWPLDSKASPAGWAVGSRQRRNT
jgi:hypothetical protein